MIDPEMVIGDYTVPLNRQDFRVSGWPVVVKYDFPRDVLCTVFATKFTKGNEAADGEMPLIDCLLEPWPADLHFTQYSCNPSVRCLKANADSYPLSFKFAAFDADFVNHSQPSREDFANLVRKCWLIDEVPNVLYETKHGARLIYLIDEINDPEEFERHYTALLNKLSAIFARSGGYSIDCQTKDWSRLFRAPLVRRDGEAEYGRMVRKFHDGVMDMRTFKPKKRPERKPRVGGLPYIGCDHRLDRMLRQNLVEGSRNTALFSTFCYIFRMYAEDQREQPVELARKRASESGLDDREIDATYRSAMNTTNNEQGKK